MLYLTKRSTCTWNYKLSPRDLMLVWSRIHFKVAFRNITLGYKILIIFKWKLATEHNHQFFPYNEDDCRVINFVDYEDGEALNGHVIAKLKVPNESTCRLQCYLNDHCVSYNFGPGETGDDYICELNNSTDRQNLKTRKYFIFQGSEVIWNLNHTLLMHFQKYFLWGP